MNDKISRKDFVKKFAKYSTSLAGSSLLLGSGYSFFANSKYKLDFPIVEENNFKFKPNGKTVLILGGGLSGLQAGCELVDKGFKVIVLEKTAIPGGKLKSWKDKYFAKKYFKNSPYTREHGLHGVWGFYKNLREFMGRHNIPINKLKDNESFYFHLTSLKTQSKIEYATWPIPFDKIQMISHGIYIPSFEDRTIPAPKPYRGLLTTFKFSSFNYLDSDQRNYLDSLTFREWANRFGVGEEYIQHYYNGLAEMGFFMKTDECSALAMANFIRLAAVPMDSRVDYFKWPPDETFINPMVDYIRANNGEVIFNQEVTSLSIVDNKITSVKTNENLPKNSKRCRICGNIIDASHKGECPFCGAHESMLELLSDSNSKIREFTADHVITAMDLPGAKKFISNNNLHQHNYFKKISKLSTASIFCVNLLYEKSIAWETRFPKDTYWNAHAFLPTGFKVLGFTSNWSTLQIPGLTKEKVDLIEVQVANTEFIKGKSFKEIAAIVHDELKSVVPDLPEFSEYYVNHWDNYTGFRPGDEANRPEIQSPIDNLCFIGDWIFIPHQAVFMEKTNVAAKMVTNLLLSKEKQEDGQITILKSGTPDWMVDNVLPIFFSVKA